LLGQLAASQFAAEAALADLIAAGGDVAVAGALRSQLAQLSELRQQIGSASGIALAALRNEVATATGNAASIAQQARTATANATEAASNASGNIAQAASAAHSAVHAVIDNLRDFDGDLRFATGADQVAYREREAERLAYIQTEEAKHTPGGDLNASGAALGQLIDAKAFGADANPAFQKRADDLIRATENLRPNLVREGRDVSEFDNRLRGDIRRILKSKGLSDAEIDAQFAAHHGDPLEVAKAFVKGEDDLKTIRHAMTYASEIQQSTVQTDDAATHDTVASAAALLKAAGVAASDPPAIDNAAAPVHGVTARPTGQRTAIQLG
jgi:hypothetical protein